MLEQDRPCSEILQQIVSVRSAIEQLGILYLTEHLQSCVLGEGHSAENRCRELSGDEQTTEIRQTLKRFIP